MERKKVFTFAGAAAGVALVAWLGYQRWHDTVRQTPDWKDPQQPVEGTGGMPANGVPAAPSPTAAWYAVRPGSPGLMQAGSRIRRVYAGNLVDDPESLVR